MEARMELKKDMQKLKDKISHNWRQFVLLAGVVVISGGNINAAERQDNIKDQAPKAYFSPKQLAEGLFAAEANDSTCNAFMEAYLQQLDGNGKITPQGLVTAMGEAGITQDQAKKISGVLFAKDKAEEKGYDFGSYTVDFSIDKQGNLTRMNFQGDKNLSDKDINEVHFARCRHKELAYDDSQERFASELLLDKMLIRDIVLEKQNTPDAVVNGEAFLQNFDNELAKNGLEIGKDNRLHGIEASRDKPLLSKQDLLNRYAQQRMKEMKDFYGR